MTTGELLSQIEPRVDGIVEVDWSPDYSLVGISYPMLTHIYATNSGELVLDDPSGCCLNWSPRGDLLAYARSFDVLIWDTKLHSLLAQITDASSYRRMAWSPDGTLLAVASSDGRLAIYQTSTWELVSMWGGNLDSIITITWGKNGMLVVWGEIDETPSLWNIKYRE